MNYPPPTQFYHHSSIAPAYPQIFTFRSFLFFLFFFFPSIPFLISHMSMPIHSPFKLFFFLILIILYFLLLIKLYLITKVRPQIFTNYCLLWSSIYLASHQDLSSFLFSCCLLTAQFYLDCLSLKQISQKRKQNFNSNTVIPTVK